MIKKKLFLLENVKVSSCDFGEKCGRAPYNDSNVEEEGRETVTCSCQPSAVMWLTEPWDK